MASFAHITAEYVRQILKFDAATGDLIWKHRKGNNHFNSLFAGKIAGGLRKGYLRIRIGQHRINAHRVVWLILHGEWPKDQLDHRDGARDRNVSENLREATNSQNAQNRKRRRTNRSGVTGVWKQKNRWRSEIGIGGKRIYVGMFKTKQKARAAYLSAKAQHHDFQPQPRVGA